MICKKCGCEMSEGSIFCGECGTKYEAQDLELEKLVDEIVIADPEDLLDTDDLGEADNLAESDNQIEADNHTEAVRFKFCGKCGTRMEEDCDFCPECGAPQRVQTTIDIPVTSRAEVESRAAARAAAEARESNATASNGAQDKKPAKAKKGLIFGAIGACLLMVVVAILIAFSFMSTGINLNKYASVSVEGYNTIGKATLVFDEEKFREDYGKKFQKDGKNLDAFIEMCLSGGFDKESGLSNGDLIKYKWGCNAATIRDTYGYKVKFSDIEYEVSKLIEAETFNPFEGVEFVFEGLDSEGTVRAEGSPVADAAKDLTYVFDRNSGLTNGDVIKVSLGLDEESVIDYCLENYGKIPSPTEMELTVTGLSGYVTSASQISAADLIKLQQQANDVFDAYRANDWGEGETLKEISYVGNYFLKTKDEASFQNNTIYLIYKVKVTNSYSNGSDNYKKVNTFYWYTAFDGLLINDEGVLTVNIAYYSTPSNRVEFDSNISSGWFSTKSWTYYGYKNLEEMHSKLISANAVDYESEDNTSDDGNTDAGNQEASDDSDDSDDAGDASPEEGIIFPNSSSVVITQEQMEELSDEDLQKAINELYARAGYIFKSDEWNKYYSKYDWYEPKVKFKDFKESMFNEVEYENYINLMGERERRKG